MYGNFKFKYNSEVIFGKDTELETGALVKKHGGSKVMIVYGGGSVVKSGLLKRVIDSLDESGIKHVEFGGVQPNPRRSYAEEGLKLAMNENVDFLLGIGGGSAIDTAKAIALGAANGGDFWQFFTGTPHDKTLPIGTIHTIAATGSETSRSFVLVDDTDSGQKKGLWTIFRPCFAIMNPELTYTLPTYQCAAGCTDIFAHTYMRYFSNYDSYLGDRYCEATMKTVVKYAPLVIAEPENYEAKAEIMLAGSFSHCDLMMIGRPEGQSGGEHALESQLSGYYDTTHGAGLAVIMPALLKYFIQHGTEKQVARVAMFAKNVFDVQPSPEGDSETAEIGVERFTEWLKSIDMPVTLGELGVPSTDVPEAVSRCMKARGDKISGFMDLDEAAVLEIYNLCA